MVRKIVVKIMLVIIVLVAVVGVGGYVFMRNPSFGRIPEGGKLEAIKKSPRYKDGKFQNTNFTPDLTEGVGYVEVMRSFFFEKSDRVAPVDRIPSQKTDLVKLDPSHNVLVWFGHSGYFMQIDGKKFLVDPVLSGNASPIPGSLKSYPGSDVYTVEELPEIDVLFISHDHYDHLDYETVIKLKSKVKKVITGLGTGEHFESWGYDPSKINANDWYEETDLADGFTVTNTPARHFSGRGFTRQQSLWTSFVLKTPRLKIFIGGDSGYDTHFAEIGDKFGPFDLVMLECGQYNKNWKYIHTMPEDVVKEAQDLKTKRLMPVHWGKFTLAQHAWDEPIISVSQFAKKANLPLVTPMIGEVVNLNDSAQVFSPWWEKVK